MAKRPEPMYAEELLRRYASGRRALRGVVLRGTRLCEVTLSRADLTGADLRRSELMGTDLFAARLSAADLSGANLTGADLRQADRGRRGDDAREVIRQLRVGDAVLELLGPASPGSPLRQCLNGPGGHGQLGCQTTCVR